LQLKLPALAINWKRAPLPARKRQSVEKPPALPKLFFSLKLLIKNGRTIAHELSAFGAR